MSDLETSVRPVLGPLVRDIAIPLHEEDQKIIALWAFKSACVFEATKPKGAKRFYKPDDKQQLTSAGRLPDTSFIWMGRFDTSNLASTAADFVVRLAGEGETGDGVVATMVLGHVVLQILSLRFPENLIASAVDLEVKPNNWESCLQQIHPYERTVLWPPPLTFVNGKGKLGLEYLTYRWNNPPIPDEVPGC